MKSTSYLALLLAAATSASAQLFQTPTPAQYAAYDALFSTYKFTSDANFQTTPFPVGQTNGGGWSNSLLSFDTYSSALTFGGSVEVVFLGESAAWLNDFSYTSTSAVGDIPIQTDIQSIKKQPGTANIKPLDSFTFDVEAGGAFDFWLFGSASQKVDGATLAPNGKLSGKHYVFEPGLNQPPSQAGKIQYYWKTVSDPLGGDFTVIGFEDVLVQHADRDFNDFMFAFRVNPNDQPGPGLPPVPEPSTYGMLGAAALVGVVMWRRFRRTAAAAPTA